MRSKKGSQSFRVERKKGKKRKKSEIDLPPWRTRNSLLAERTSRKKRKAQGQDVIIIEKKREEGRR